MIHNWVSKLGLVSKPWSKVFRIKSGKKTHLSTLVKTFVLTGTLKLRIESCGRQALQNNYNICPKRCTESNSLSNRSFSRVKKVSEGLSELSDWQSRLKICQLLVLWPKRAWHSDKTTVHGIISSVLRKFNYQTINRDKLRLTWFGVKLKSKVDNREVERA